MVAPYILNSILCVGDSFKLYFGLKSLFEGYYSLLLHTNTVSFHLTRVSSAHIYFAYIFNKVPFQLYVKQSDT